MIASALDTIRMDVSENAMMGEASESDTQSMSMTSTSAMMETTSESEAVADVDDNDNDNDEAELEEPEQSIPRFSIYQKVLAKDNETPLLYEALVRKRVYGPKTRNLRLSLMVTTEEGMVEDELAAMMADEPPKIWHYFVHFNGWNVKWDRWVDEEKLFEDTEDARVLAKRLKNEAKVLKKNKSQKKTLEVMQRIVRLEQELRQKQARGESIEASSVSARARASASASDATGMKKSEPNHGKTEQEIADEEEKARVLREEQKKEGVTNAFISREIKLRKMDLRSRKCSINLPFTLKKILTDDWEVITQCDMLHSLPATVSIKDALDAYLDGKLRSLAGSGSGSGRSSNTATGKGEEKKDDDYPQIVSGEILTEDDGDNDNENDNGAQEWCDMVEGIALFFDQALTKSLLYRHEIPQCLLLEQNHEKRYSELYPCEYLIRLCLKFPDVVADADYTEQHKGQILFKIGDLLRFLQKHQDVYLLQRYRKANIEEKAKADKLKRKLGLEKAQVEGEKEGGEQADEESSDEEADANASEVGEDDGEEADAEKLEEPVKATTKRKRKHKIAAAGGKQRKKRR